MKLLLENWRMHLNEALGSEKLGEEILRWIASRDRREDHGWGISDPIVLLLQWRSQGASGFRAVAGRAAPEPLARYMASKKYRDVALETEKKLEELLVGRKVVVEKSINYDGDHPEAASFEGRQGVITKLEHHSRGGPSRIWVEWAGDDEVSQFLNKNLDFLLSFSFETGPIGTVHPHSDERRTGIKINTALVNPLELPEVENKLK